MTIDNQKASAEHFKSQFLTGLSEVYSLLQTHKYQANKFFKDIPEIQYISQNINNILCSIKESPLYTENITNNIQDLKLCCEIRFKYDTSSESVFFKDVLDGNISSYKFCSNVNKAKNILLSVQFDKFNIINSSTIALALEYISSELSFQGINTEYFSDIIQNVKTNDIMQATHKYDREKNMFVPHVFNFHVYDEEHMKQLLDKQSEEIKQNKLEKTDA